jgi:hypothetical protein
MKSSYPAMLVGVIFTTLFFVPTSVEAQVYSGPRCIGPACIDREMPIERLAEQLGGPSSAGGAYSYRTQNGDAFLIISGYGILQSVGLGGWSDKNDKVTTQDIRNWKTPEGIGLGSPEEDIARAYGKPSGAVDLEIEDSQRQMGKRMLIYKGRLNEVFRAARFRLRDGKVSWIELENDAFLGPDCLGPYCTYRELSLNSLLRRLGLPPQEHAPSPIECFQSRDAQAFLHVSTDIESISESSLGDVLLTDFPNCSHMPKRIATNGLRAWRTPEGIGLGSPEEAIRKAYGIPSAEKKLDAQNPGFAMEGLIAGYRAGDNQPRVGEKVIIYGPLELQVTEFGIRDGKVSYIWLKDSDYWLTKSQ